MSAHSSRAGLCINSDKTELSGGHRHPFRETKLTRCLPSYLSRRKT